MPDDIEMLLRRMVGGNELAATEILDRAATSDYPPLLVAAAVISDDATGLLARAVACATTTRDRQLVALATAHLNHDEDLLDALVRDHLSDHPDNILAAWIATQHPRPGHGTRSSHKE